MAIVVDLQLGRSLAAVGPHNAVVELLDETRRGARDYPGDLAHLPSAGRTSPSVTIPVILAVALGLALGQAQPMSTLTPSSHARSLLSALFSLFCPLSVNPRTSACRGGDNNPERLKCALNTTVIEVLRLYPPRVFVHTFAKRTRIKSVRRQTMPDSYKRSDHFVK